MLSTSNCSESCNVVEFSLTGTMDIIKKFVKSHVVLIVLRRLRIHSNNIVSLMHGIALIVLYVQQS